MTWAFIDEFGFDKNIYNGVGGNNIALQLVIDGLKLQSCSPGFIDGRDAILAAVEVSPYFTTPEERADAACLVWTTFAARGLGFSASQGNRFSRTDQTEAFDLPPDNLNPCLGPLSTRGFDITSFSVYPNPSNGDLNISLTRSLGEGSISIYDINGREVYSQKASLEGTVNVQAGGLASGIYLLQVRSDVATETVKLIIE